ncbi:MAG: heparinase II/III domain-containing protein, partial [Candidatus Latescibacterota bacterium]
TGPTGLYLNYADSGEKNTLQSIPCLFWLARRYGNQFFSDREHAMIAKQGADPLHLVWYAPPSKSAALVLELDSRFRGPTEVAIFRSGWNTPEALFVGVKAGDNTFNHAHLDLGAFELDALGVRWARDLGSDNYSLPGYFDFYYLTGKTGGERWTYYRMASVSHNVPIMNGASQNELAAAAFTSYISNPSYAHVIVDLSKAYDRHATRAQRGIAVIDNRRATLVQDEFDLTGPAGVAWNMLTDAEITLEGSRAILRQGGKTLTAQILEPSGASFSVESAGQKPPQKENKGVNRLMVRIPGKKGALRIAVLLAPQWKEGAVKTIAKVVPLAEWEKGSR